jgi:hypothetical protein
MDFFWLEKWIASDHEMLSLEDLAIRAMGVNYKRPEFFIATGTTDGYGWGYSDAELSMFAADPVLSTYATLARRFDPNSKIPFMELGADLGKILVRDPYGMAGRIQPSSKIYISNAWAPADLVELMVHEYGHVLHGEVDSNISWEADTRMLVVRSNKVHDESVAESVAWMLLRNIYERYPEVQFFHLAKLQLFQFTRSKDPHLVGAAAVHRLFHSESDGTYADLIEYAGNLDLGTYLLSHGFKDCLEDLGSNTFESVPVFFETH